MNVKEDNAEKLLHRFLENCRPEEPDTSLIMEKTWQKIRHDAARRRRNFFLAASVSIAASVLLCVSAIHFLSGSGEEAGDVHAMLSQQEDPAAREVTLTTAKKQLTLDKESFIQYTKEGNVAVNAQKVEAVKAPEETAVAAEEEYDQLWVPAGKRAKLELADGTVLTVNSRSKVVFPRRFTGEERKIYARGEVFLEVAHDSEHPFIVEANGFDLRVLGTKFNISSYEGEAASVVLVEGSVEVTDTHRQTARMVPSDLLDIADGTITSQRQVDVTAYISWTDGILMLDGNDLATVCRKLSRYYGVSVRCDSSVGREKVYGKLDIKDNVDEVVESLRQTVPFIVDKKEESIYLHQ